MPGVWQEVHQPFAHAVIPAEDGPGKGDLGADVAGGWLRLDRVDALHAACGVHGTPVAGADGGP